MNKYMSTFVNEFGGKNIFIVGDLMLDKYIWGSVDRISPEAPVQVVAVQKESYVPGGAANVANNIVSLGGNAILCGVVGKDEAKNILQEQLDKEKVVSYLIEDSRPTIQKVRVVSQNQQLLRIDYEDKKYVEEHVEKKVLDFLKNQEEIDVIVISDYAKGIVTEQLVKQIVEHAKIKSIPVIVDPKPKHIDYYKDVTLITPNQKEALEMVEDESMNVDNIGELLENKIDANILITRGKDGMSLYERDDKPAHIPTKAKEVFDVSGAGDTVISTIALAVATGAGLKDSAIIANHAAGVVVGKVGTSTLTAKELIDSIENE